MKKKCKKCEIPLEGFLYNMIASKIFGVKPSEDPDVYNKCIDKTEKSGCCCCK